MARALGKHTPYYELVEAQIQGGCPICRLVYKATDRYLDSILYEAVLDPDVRDKLKGAWGFCAEHVEALHHKPGRALGIALIYRDIIRAIAQIADGGHIAPSRGFLDRLRGRTSSRSALAADLATDRLCPACVVGQEATDNYLDLVIAHLGDEDLYSAYSQGEGLCLPHFIGAIERVRDEDALQRLVRPQISRYLAMLSDLDEFIRKRDHRFKGEKYGPEGDVWLRAMNAVVGGAGLGLSAKTGGRRSSDIGNQGR